MLTYADASVLSKKAAAPRAAGKENQHDRFSLLALLVQKYKY
jgi:hypothetical protein